LGVQTEGDVEQAITIPLVIGLRSEREDREGGGLIHDSRANHVLSDRNLEDAPDDPSSFSPVDVQI
jgi:hypothetical protein